MPQDKPSKVRKVKINMLERVACLIAGTTFAVIYPFRAIYLRNSDTYKTSDNLGWGLQEDLEDCRACIKENFKGAIFGYEP